MSDHKPSPLSVDLQIGEGVPQNIDEAILAGHGDKEFKCSCGASCELPSAPIHGIAIETDWPGSSISENTINKLAVDEVPSIKMDGLSSISVSGNTIHDNPSCPVLLAWKAEVEESGQ